MAVTYADLLWARDDVERTQEKAKVTQALAEQAITNAEAATLAFSSALLHLKELAAEKLKEGKTNVSV